MYVRLVAGRQTQVIWVRDRWTLVHAESCAEICTASVSVICVVVYVIMHSNYVSQISSGKYLFYLVLLMKIATNSKLDLKFIYKFVLNCSFMVLIWRVVRGFNGTHSDHIVQITDLMSTDRTLLRHAQWKLAIHSTNWLNTVLQAWLHAIATFGPLFFFLCDGCWWFGIVGHVTETTFDGLELEGH